MNKQMRNTLLVCFAIPLLFAIMGSAGSSIKDFPIILGTCFVIAGFLYLLPGVILAAIKSRKYIGMGVLLSSGLLLLIGFSICSTQTLSFH